MSNIGHNNPPSPINAVMSEYDDVISEAQNWTDGEPVTDKAGMDAVDSLLKQFKKYRTALTKAGKEQTDPYHKAWKAAVADVKVCTDDADLIQKALVATVAPFKAKLAAEQEAERKAAWEAANKARQEAEALAAKADASNLDAQREAEAAKQAVIDAEKTAKTVDSVKGMRTVKHFEVCDMRALVNWIAKNDKVAMADFANEYARKNNENIPDDVVRSWSTKEAF